MSAILAKIFNSQPTKSSGEYIERGITRLRRMLTSTLPPSAPNLPASLPPASLPPSGGETLNEYEQNILDEIYDATGSLIVLRGGAGSGKSSLMWYLSRYAQQRATALTSDDIVRPLLHFMLVDVQTVVATEEGQSDLDGLLRALARSLQVSVTKAANKGMLGQLLLEMLQSPDQEFGTAATVVTLAMSAVEQACKIPPESWAQLDGRARVEQFCDASDKLQAAEQLILWIAVVGAIGRHFARRTHCTWPFVVAFDNIDPLPGVLISSLVQRLKPLCDALGGSSVKVLLSVRLSTFQVHCGTHILDVVEHTAPDPVEVAFARAAVALLQPGSYRRDGEAGGRDESSIQARLLALIAHLTDRTGYFSPLLRSIAGSNVRNGLLFISQWAASTNISAAPVDEPKALLLSMLGKHYLEDLVFSFTRSVRIRLGAHYSGNAVSSQSCASIVEDALASVVEDVRAMVAERGPDGNNPRKLRALILEAAWARVVEAAREDLTQRGPDDPSFSFISMCAEIQGALGDARMIGLSEAGAIGVAKAVADVFEGEQTNLDDGHRTLRRWVAKALRTTVREGRTAKSYRRQRAGELAHESNLLRRVVSTWESHESRYQAERRLLGTATEARQQPRVLNVFTVNRSEVCPIALHCLVYLGNREAGSVTRMELLDHLSAWGYVEKDIVAALSEMVRVDRRLIYSGVKDQFDGIPAWMGHPSERVALSIAGGMYLRSLVHVPAYLQWAVQDIHETRRAASEELKVGETQLDRTIIHRLATVRIGLKHIVKSERSRREQRLIELQQDPGGIPAGFDEIATPPTSDIVMHALVPFLRVYQVLSRAFDERGDRGDAATVKREAEEWLNLGRATFDGCAPGRSDWQNILDDAREECHGLFAARI